MAEAEHVLREKLAAVFARQDFYEACQRQDAGAMVAILDAGNVTQGQIAARTGIAQSTLSNKTGKFDEAQQLAGAMLAGLSPEEGKRAAVIREIIAAAHLARGSAVEAAQVAQGGLAIIRETEFTMWLPKFEDIARALFPRKNQPAIRAYLEEFAMTKRQLAPAQR